MKKLVFSALWLVMLAAGCTTESPLITTPSNQPPIAHIDSISPTEFFVGDTVMFAGHGTDSDGTVTAYQWQSSLDGDLSVMPSFETSTLSEGEHSIYFRVQDNEGAWSEGVQSVVVAKKTVPPPVIDFFHATPVRIGLGGSTNLSWYVSEATTVHINQGIGNVALTGNREVSPTISTSYTLTATNESSSTSSTATVIVVPQKVGLPVINSFAADPGTITAGNSALLTWNVSNAEFITIEPGIGTIDPIGNISISPDITTTYTITAYNYIGIVTVSTQVLVTTEPTSGKPDLVITDIRKIETAVGIKIAYTIENKGTNGAPSSTTRLYANGVYKALDSVGPLAAGASEIKQVTGWLYNPATNIIKIVLDADNNVVESNEVNNVNQVPFPVKVRYDFVDNAVSARWGSGYPYESLTFGGSIDDDRGFALYRTDKRLEDFTDPRRLLETHPRWTYGGWIIGDYDIDLEVKPGYYFYGLVGLLEGASAGDVKFWVYIRSDGESEWDTLVHGVEDIYDYRIKAIAVPIPPAYFGKNIDFSLRVSANGEPLQDWATWVDAKIVQ